MESTYRPPPSVCRLCFENSVSRRCFPPQKCDARHVRLKTKLTRDQSAASVAGNLDSALSLFALLLKGNSLDQIPPLKKLSCGFAFVPFLAHGALSVGAYLAVCGGLVQD